MDEIVIGRPYTMIYKNYRGETEERQVMPQSFWWGTTQYHPEPGFMMRAYCTSRAADRDFAVSGIVTMRPGAPDQKPKVEVTLDPPKPVTVAVRKDPNSVRPDLPKAFTWTPTVHQRDRFVKNNRITIERFVSEGQAISWPELAAVLEVRPVSFMREVPAAQRCLILYPQKGFTL